MGNITKKARNAANKEALAAAIARDEEFGRRKTQKEYAEEFGVTDRTIRGWMREMELEPDI